MNHGRHGREVYATGVRNSVGMDFNPKDKHALVHRQPDRRHGRRHPDGRDQPRDQGRASSSAIRTSSGKTRITEFGYDKDPIPAGAVDPQVMRIAHAADLGMAFYTGKQFPAKYQGGFFSAQHGSWNRTKPIGARVLFTSLKADGTRRQDRGLRRGLARRRDRHLPRPAGRRRGGEGRLAARLRRLRRRHLPHHLHGAVSWPTPRTAGAAAAAALAAARRCGVWRPTPPPGARRRRRAPRATARWAVASRPTRPISPASRRCTSRRSCGPTAAASASTR